jgi:transportin-1
MRMFPLLECLTSLLAAISLEAQQYVLAIYSRCVRIAGTVLSAHHQHQQQAKQQGVTGAEGLSDKSGNSTGGTSTEEHDLPSKDFAICALDVVSALCEGLGDMFTTLARDAGGHTQDTLFQLMFAALGDPLPELRQCGFSLAGEISRHAFTLLTPAVAGQLLQSCVECVHPDYPLVCNNAAWAAGELALKVGGDFLQPFVTPLMNRLVTGAWELAFSLLDACCASVLSVMLTSDNPAQCRIAVLQSAHLPENIRVNVAVTIGRLAMVDTLEVPALADEYFADWCR